MKTQKNGREPNTYNDPILALAQGYFFAAEVMHDHLHDIKPTFFANPDNFSVQRKFKVYLAHWLSSLWVVAHGFRHALKLNDPKIDPLLDENFGSLSDFRNATYHYNQKRDKQIAFIQSEGLNWAGELPNEFYRYFSSYVHKRKRKNVHYRMSRRAAQIPRIETRYQKIRKKLRDHGVEC